MPLGEGALTSAFPRGCAAPPSSQTECRRGPGTAARSLGPGCRGNPQAPPGTTTASPLPRGRPLGARVYTSVPQPCTLGGEHSTPNGHWPELHRMRRLAKAKSAPRDEVQQRVRYWRVTGAERGTPGEGNWWPQAEQSWWPGMPQALAHALFLWPGGWGLGAPVIWVGSWVWCSGSLVAPQPSLPLLNPIPAPHSAAAVGGARGPRLQGLTSWSGSSSTQTAEIAIGLGA